MQRFYIFNQLPVLLDAQIQIYGDDALNKSEKSRIKERMDQAHEKGEMERFRNLKRKLQKLNDAGAYRSERPKASRKDRLKDRMDRAKEKGNDERYRRFKRELQQMNEAGPYAEESNGSSRKDVLKRRMDEAQEKGTTCSTNA